jgi:hypothetical protein
MPKITGDNARDVLPINLDVVCHALSSCPAGYPCPRRYNSSFIAGRLSCGCLPGNFPLGHKAALNPSLMDKTGMRAAIHPPRVVNRGGETTDTKRHQIGGSLPAQLLSHDIPPAVRKHHARILDIFWTRFTDISDNALK